MTEKEKFLDLLKRYVNSHSIYLWGAQGEQVKKLTAETIRKMETSAANASRVLRRIELLKEMKWITTEVDMPTPWKEIPKEEYDRMGQNKGVRAPLFII